MAEAKSLREHVAGTRVARAFAARAVGALDARERRSGVPTWHRPPAPAWALERLRLFEHVPAAEVAALAADARVTRYPNRATALLGEDADVVWIVLEGGVKLCRVGALGGRLVEALLGPGDLFGRVSTVAPAASYELQSIEPSRVAALSRGRFEGLLRAHPELGLAVVEDLEGRQRRLVRRLESLVFKDVHARVAEAILELVRSERGPCSHGFAVDVRITQGDLAELVGASRQMVNRVLGDLERRLYVQRAGRVLCVLHVERLERLVEA